MDNNYIYGEDEWEEEEIPELPVWQSTEEGAPPPPYAGYVHNATIINKNTLSNIANAIRKKARYSDDVKIQVSEYADLINSIGDDIPSNYEGIGVYISSNSNNLYNFYQNNIDISLKSNYPIYPICGNNVTDMSYTYRYCTKLTGSPVCGPNVTDMGYTYRECSNLTGSPVCGPNVTNMGYTYCECSNLTGSPVCGPNVTNMFSTYFNCTNLTGSPVCSPNVTDMGSTYRYCTNLTGSPVCSNNVTYMGYTYGECSNLTGSPVCGNNVTYMGYTYFNCRKLTGSPVCGPNVTNMFETYFNCSNLTGYPVCGPNVTNMFSTYFNCRNLTGTAIIEKSVFDASNAFSDCFMLNIAIINKHNTLSLIKAFNSTRIYDVYVPYNIEMYLVGKIFDTAWGFNAHNFITIENNSLIREVTLPIANPYTGVIYNKTFNTTNVCYRNTLYGFNIYPSYL